MKPRSWFTRSASIRSSSALFPLARTTSRSCTRRRWKYSRAMPRSASGCDWLSNISLLPLFIRIMPTMPTAPTKIVRLITMRKLVVSFIDTFMFFIGSRYCLMYVARVSIPAHISSK